MSQTDVPDSTSSVPVSTAQHVANGGLLCPYCGSSSIEGKQHFYFMEEGLTQEVQCNDCDHTWTDCYQLIGYRAESL